MDEPILQLEAPLEHAALPRRWLRSPLAWAIALELCVTVALLAVAWHVFQSHRSASLLIPEAPIPPARPAPLPSLPAVPGAHAATPRSQANLRHDTPFMKRQLNEINREQSGWERAQWSLVQAVTNLVRGYLERVVLPAVRQASNRGP